MRKRVRKRGIKPCYWLNVLVPVKNSLTSVARPYWFHFLWLMLPFSSEDVLLGGCTMKVNMEQGRKALIYWNGRNKEQQSVFYGNSFFDRFKQPRPIDFKIPSYLTLPSYFTIVFPVTQHKFPTLSMGFYSRFRRNPESDDASSQPLQSSFSPTPHQPSVLANSLHQPPTNQPLLLTQPLIR